MLNLIDSIEFQAKNTKVRSEKTQLIRKKSKTKYKVTSQMNQCNEKSCFLQRKQYGWD